MIWGIFLAALAAVALFYTVHHVRTSLKLSKKASSEARAAKATDFQQLMDRALKSRPIQRSREE